MQKLSKKQKIFGLFVVVVLSAAKPMLLIRPSKAVLRSWQMEGVVMRRKTSWRKSSGALAWDILQAHIAPGPAFIATNATLRNCDWSNLRM